MENNLLLEQYSRYKKMSLEDSPFRCLLNADIELNPHQVNAFIAAIQALKTGGIILADEVGLGKTIEAALVLNYILDSGAKRIMIVLPATLRKQWEVELSEKFDLNTTILDRLSVERDYYATKAWIEDKTKTRIVITSYDYSSKLMKRFPRVKWDFIIIDEAHNLRNVFHGTKRAKRLYDLTIGIPKILLTATPLQNSLTDLHGLVSFIDPRVFGPEKVFARRFMEGQDYSELKKELLPVLYRTLRRDVASYMDFRQRICLTVDFKLTQEEEELYRLVNTFLKRETLYSIPVNNRGLIILVIRKLLSSSSFALIDTFEILKTRLEKLYQGTKSANAQEGFDLFWEFVEDEIDESDFEEAEDADIEMKKQQIQEEIDAVNQIIAAASVISANAKIVALKTALSIAFSKQESMGIDQKVVVFTESKRTQKYIAEELRKDGYAEEDILLFNGDFDDAMTKTIYNAWRAKNYGGHDYGRSIEYKHAIVDYFKDNARILIVTDAGSEGLNLQFCNTVINYDLPWNPQKIEQRIGRCHRYGQKHDVVAINLLNTENAADRRVYEILSKKFVLFEGVFGASDVALGVLESGTSFEKKVLDIYQKCDLDSEFNKEFDKLDRALSKNLNNQARQLQTILLTESPEAKGEALEETRKQISKYLHDKQYWSQFEDPEMDGSHTYYWQIDNWGEKYFGSKGTLFLGAFCDNNRLLFPVLQVFDECGECIALEEDIIIQALEQANDDDIRYFTPTDKEKEIFEKNYDRLYSALLEKYDRSVEPVKEYNRLKIENWAKIQNEQLALQVEELSKEVEELFMQESFAKNTLEKKDILKKAAEKRDKLEKLQRSIPRKTKKIQSEAKAEIEEFDNMFKVNPILLVNIVLKF